jgi:hypothetical protein
MRPYLEGYFDLYWDLHPGVKGDAIPAQVRQIGESFNTVLAYRDPTQKIVYDSYMIVRANLSYLKTWINDRLADLTSGKTPDPEKTFAYYWMKNAGDGENFAHQDVVFECFHNFVAFSQWGNTIYNIMLKLGADGDPGARTWFRSARPWRAISTMRMVRRSRRSNGLSWNCSARYRRTAGASRLSRS